MGYFKNLEIGEQVEVGDRRRRSTYIKQIGVVVISRRLLITALSAMWAQTLIIAGLLVFGATK
jgi:hypothetical protein